LADLVFNEKLLVGFHYSVSEIGVLVSKDASMEALFSGAGMRRGLCEWASCVLALLVYELGNG
jgi:hypothetical protein